MIHFEDRHRELRRALGGYPYADEAAAEAADRADVALHSFYSRTAPAVDEVVGAVRELTAMVLAPHSQAQLRKKAAFLVGKLYLLDEAAERG